MKQKTFESRRAYEAPAVTEVNLTSEGILCLSGGIEKFNFIDDLDGWEII